MYSSPNREQTIESHIKYADKIAYLFVKKTGIYNLRDEIKSTAYEGLIKAVDSFDPSKGMNIKSYLFHKVNFEILNFLRDNDYLSRNHRIKIKINGEDNPTHVPIENCLSVKSKINTEESYCSKQHSKILSNLIDTFSERKRYIVKSIVSEEKTMKELGFELGVTESRISQIYAQACIMIVKRGKKYMEDNQSITALKVEGCPAPQGIITYLPEKEKDIEAIEGVVPPRRCKCGAMIPTNRKVKVCANCWGKQRNKPKQIQENKTQKQEEISKLNKKEFIILSFEKDHGLAEDIKVIAQAERRSVEDQILFFLEESCNNFIETREQWNKYALSRSKV
ncbi:hypothetical protein A2619_02370 [candidate division WWE3 bacterium RIFOXYD1_FULL_39_9]|uniref:RNA polymerase sigma-70 region 2 domain-containing protein n=1 Tax=candidate division WWE3 bacterium RIFOXYD1_FULL_39_9 TaxID=1802649 RepID=A0A1F4X3U9_UNCKA|nr:MAG: hypothetical protein A2619_02370 [candidate division WWE3 bacterium RIFOXYD1_FULL_39_9]